MTCVIAEPSTHVPARRSVSTADDARFLVALLRARGVEIPHVAGHPPRS